VIWTAAREPATTVPHDCSRERAGVERPTRLPSITTLPAVEVEFRPTASSIRVAVTAPPNNESDRICACAVPLRFVHEPSASETIDAVAIDPVAGYTSVASRAARMRVDVAAPMTTGARFGLAMMSAATGHCAAGASGYEGAAATCGAAVVVGGGGAGAAAVVGAGAVVVGGGGAAVVVGAVVVTVVVTEVVTGVGAVVVVGTVSVVVEAVVVASVVVVGVGSASAAATPDAKRNAAAMPASPRRTGMARSMSNPIAR